MEQSAGGIPRAMHLYQHGMDLTLVFQWLVHANLESTLIHAYADAGHKRQAIARALGDSAAPGLGLLSSLRNTSRLWDACGTIAVGQQGQVLQHLVEPEGCFRRSPFPGEVKFWNNFGIDVSSTKHAAYLMKPDGDKFSSFPMQNDRSGAKMISEKNMSALTKPGLHEEWLDRQPMCFAEYDDTLTRRFVEQITVVDTETIHIKTRDVDIVIDGHIC